MLDSPRDADRARAARRRGAGAPAGPHPPSNLQPARPRYDSASEESPRSRQAGGGEGADDGGGGAAAAPPASAAAAAALLTRESASTWAGGEAGTRPHAPPPRQDSALDTLAAARAAVLPLLPPRGAAPPPARTHSPMRQDSALETLVAARAVALGDRAGGGGGGGGGGSDDSAHGAPRAARRRAGPRSESAFEETALRSVTCAAPRPLLPTARRLAPTAPPLAVHRSPITMGPVLSLLRGRGGLRPLDARAAASDAAAGDAWLIVGLGNPGPKYDGTRHNIGFAAVDALAARAGASCDRAQCKAAVGRALLDGRRVILAKPQTYMNLSGDSVAALAAFYKVPPDRTIVIYDDMDTPLGAARLRAKGGAGGHNGIKSILARLGAAAPFVRVRVGVGRPPPYITVVDWVLTRFDAGERDAAAQGVDAAVDAARSVVELGLQKALSGCRVVAGGGGRLHSAPPHPRR